MSTTNFKFWIPGDCIKAEETSDGKRIIRGRASAEAVDLQGEKVIQNGIDYNYFLKSGFIVDDHKTGVENRVGEPLEAKITNKGLEIKALIYKGKERSDYWWEHLKAIEASGSKRPVGFSIEGKILKRKGSVIEKCWLSNVAITTNPVCVDTFAEIVKSLSAEKWVDKPNACPCPKCPGECNYDPNVLMKDDEENEDKEAEKALSAGSSSGMALSPESLEGSGKVTTYKSLASIPDDAVLGFDDYVRTLQISEGFSKSTAEAVVHAIFLERGVY
jgi:hypothetical protein